MEPNKHAHYTPPLKYNLPRSLKHESLDLKMASEGHPSTELLRVQLSMEHREMFGQDIKQKLNYLVNRHDTTITTEIQSTSTTQSSIMGLGWLPLLGL